MDSTLKLDLTIIPAEVILITKDYIESIINTDISISYDKDIVILCFQHANIKRKFENSMGDYLLRYKISNKYHSIKEIIIGRALYGIVDELR